MVLQVATIIIGSILCPGNPYKRYALRSMIEFGMCLSFHGSLSNSLFLTRSCLMFFWISIHGIVVYRPPYCPMELDGKFPIYGSPVPTYINLFELFDLPVNSSWIFQKPILMFSSQRVGRGIFRLRARCLSSTDWSLRTCQCSTANLIKTTNRLVLLVRISFWQALVKSLREVYDTLSPTVAGGKS